MKKLMQWLVGSAVVSGLCSSNYVQAGWYTRYQNSDAGLTVQFDFNNADGKRVRDDAGRRFAILKNVEQVAGWQPVKSYTFDGKTPVIIADKKEVGKKGAFSMLLTGRVTGGSGYMVLKKNAFGLSFNKNKAHFYLYLQNKRTLTIPAGNYDNNHHLWVLSIEKNTARVWQDGKLISEHKLAAPLAVNENDIVLGSSCGWNKSEVIGELGLFRLYDKALTAAEVAVIHEDFSRKQVPNADSSLLMQLPMGIKNVFIGDDISYEKKEIALRFNGKDSCVQLAAYPELYSAKALTVGAWIKPEHVMPRKGETGSVISATGGARSGWSLGNYYDRGLFASVVTDKGRFTCAAYKILQPNVWQHVAFVWDGKQLQLFHNGKSVGTATLAPGKLVPFKGKMCIGKSAYSNGGVFRGAIDEVRVFTEALNSELDPETGNKIVTVGSDKDLNPHALQLPQHAAARGFKAPYKTIGDFSQASQWQVVTYKNISEATFCRSKDDPFLSEASGKLVIKGGSHYDPARKIVELIPVKPLAIEEDFDFIMFYISAQNWTKARGMKIACVIRDAAGKEHVVPMQSPAYPFVFWSGWGAMIKKMPYKISVPAKFIKLVFSDFGSQKPETYYLDSLGFSKLKDKLPAGVKVPTAAEINMPNTPTGALPTLKTPEKPCKLTVKNNVYTFVSENGKDKIVYTYKPESGTLSDISCSFNGGKSFLPMLDGGVYFTAPDGRQLKPGDAALQAKLLSIKADNNQVSTVWAWSYEGKLLGSLKLDLQARRKSLTITLEGGNKNIHAVRVGRVAGLNDAVTAHIPFWVIRSRGVNNPSVLYSNGMLMSVFNDVYYSRASQLTGGTLKYADKSVQINGGSDYQLKTDGTRNGIYEVIHLNVSSLLEEVLPHIANDANPTMNITRNSIWVTRMWYDAMPMLNYFDKAYAYIELMHRYGMRNLMIRDHQGMYGQYSPKRRGQPGNYDICPDIGGDAAAAEYFRKANDLLGYRMALYSNYTLMSPIVLKLLDFDKLALDSNSDFRYGSGASRMPKYSYWLALQEKRNRVVNKKFKLRASYPDQYTCRAPWAFTDFDARVPEAGSYAPAMRTLAKMLLVEREELQCVLSEGIMQWVLAGYCDSYGQSGSHLDPIFPEFQLRKIHVLSNDCGTHLTILAKRDPKLLDKYLAITIANGNIGHLYGVWSGRPTPDILPMTIKSYYMIKQLQTLYAGVVPENISYHYKGQMLTAEEVIAGQLLGHNQVYTKYVNGTEVYVNANEKEPWTIKIGNQNIKLPPCGFYAVSKDKKSVTYSIEVDKRRVDFSQGAEYIYANGNGKTHDFGAIKCAGNYALLFENNACELIPLPVRKNEKVYLNSNIPQLRGSTTIVALDKQRKELWKKEINAVDGVFEITVDGKAFSYKIQ